MSYTKRIVRTLAALWKTTDATVLAIGVKLISASGQNFVTVGLVSYVPNNLVFWRIECVVQGYREFDYAQTCTKMPAFFGYHVHDELPKFVTNGRQVLDFELLPQVFGLENAG